MSQQKLSKKQQAYRNNVLQKEVALARCSNDTSVFCQRCKIAGYCTAKGWKPDVAIPFIDPEKPEKGLKLDSAYLYWLCPDCASRSERAGAA